MYWYLITEYGNPTALTMLSKYARLHSTHGASPLTVAFRTIIIEVFFNVSVPRLLYPVSKSPNTLPNSGFHRVVRPKFLRRSHLEAERKQTLSGDPCRMYSSTVCRHSIARLTRCPSPQAMLIAGEFGTYRKIPYNDNGRLISALLAM